MLSVLIVCHLQQPQPEAGSGGGSRRKQKEESKHLEEVKERKKGLAKWQVRVTAYATLCNKFPFSFVAVSQSF